MNTTDHSTDFDFQQGRWRVHHRRLKARLSSCTDWEEFEGTCEQRPILGGNGNIEDNLLHISTGDYRAVALRSFNPATNAWAIWWLDGRSPHELDTPVIGGFKEGVGTFYADDVLGGRPVRMRFLWLGANTAAPRWEQAMSDDGGETWEANWTMAFTRA